MISQTGGSVQERIAEERESSNAQIRIMLDEQRRTIIAECSEKVLHHELLAAQAEQDRRILQEEFLRQQQDFRDSRDFRDVESICSGNSHVTSPPGLFPRHPPFQGMLRPSFISQQQNEEPPNIWDTSGMSGNVFAHPQTSSSAPYPQELNSTWRKTIEEPIHMSPAEKSGIPERDPDLSHLQWRRLFTELWGRPTTTADFGSSF